MTRTLVLIGLLAAYSAAQAQTLVAPDGLGAGLTPVPTRPTLPPPSYVMPSDEPMVIGGSSSGKLQQWAGPTLPAPASDLPHPVPLSTWSKVGPKTAAANESRASVRSRGTFRVPTAVTAWQARGLFTRSR